SLDIPVKDMSEKALNLVLYGNSEGPTELNLDFEQISSDNPVYATEYEGLVNQLKRWFAGGTSDTLRDWVEKYMEMKTCETCGGARLKKESLWFKVDGKNISELGDMN